MGNTQSSTLHPVFTTTFPEGVTWEMMEPIMKRNNQSTSQIIVAMDNQSQSVIRLQETQVINDRRLRTSTRQRTFESEMRSENTNWDSSMPKTRSSTRKQTEKSHLREVLHPSYRRGEPPLNLRERGRILPTNRKKYYYYTKIIKAKGPREIYDTLVIARKPKLPKNQKDFGALKLVKKDKIGVPIMYVAKFIGFEDDKEELDRWIRERRIRVSHGSEIWW